MVTFTHKDDGTPERLWRSEWRANRPLDLESFFDGRPPERLILLSAHPDDETLAAGGLLTRLKNDFHLPVDVVVATAGEASHPASTTHSRDVLARRRRSELREAVQLLAADSSVHFLDLPDGAVTALPVARALRTLLGPQPSERTLLVAPWHRDGHPDHDAAGEAARSVAEEFGMALLEYPVWLWHWAEPSSSSVPWDRMSILPLTEAELELKAAAQRMHVTQIEPLSEEPGDEVLLGPAIIEHFARPFEAFAVTPPLSAFERLHAGSKDPWGYEDRFYERRKRAVSLALLPRERYSHGLELGCSVGVLSAELAARCDSLVAVDVSPSAVGQAANRLAGYKGAEARVMRIPEEWPEGVFDLVVLSETGYYLSAAQLEAVISRCLGSLGRDGVMMLCHWRHPVDGWPLNGDAVHEAFRACPGLELFAEHQEEDFRIDILTRPGAVSVARGSGLL